MDEKMKYFEKRLGLGTWWTDNHIQELLSHISTLEAQLIEAHTRIKELEHDLYISAMNDPW